MNILNFGPSTFWWTHWLHMTLTRMSQIARRLRSFVTSFESCQHFHNILHTLLYLTLISGKCVVGIITVSEDGERMFGAVCSQWHSLDAVETVELVVVPVDVVRRQVVSDPRRHVACTYIDAVDLLCTRVSQHQVDLEHRLHLRIDEQQEVVFQSVYSIQQASSWIFITVWLIDC